MTNWNILITDGLDEVGLIDLRAAATVDDRTPTVCDGCDIFAWHPTKARRSASARQWCAANEARGATPRSP